jgi:O-antigen/teichoic acid export membrane protein
VLTALSILRDRFLALLTWPWVRATNLIVPNWTGIKFAVRSSAVVAVGLIMARLFSFGTSATIARTAGPECFGQYTLFTTFFVMAAGIALAFDNTFIRFTIRHTDSEREAGTFLILNVAAKAVFGAGCFVIGPFLANWISTHVLNRPEGAHVLAGAFFAAGVVPLFDTVIASYQSRKRFVMFGMLTPIFNGLIFFGMLVLSFTTNLISIETITVAYLSVALLLAIVAIVWMKKRISIDRVSIRRHGQDFFKVCSILASSKLINLIGNRLDVIILASTLTLVELGNYGVAIRLSVVVSLITAVMRTILMPRAAASVEDPSRLRRYLQLAGLYTCLQATTALIFALFAGSAIEWLFGPEYTNAVGPAVVLLVNAVVMGVVCALQALVQCGKRPSILVGLSIAKILASWGLLSVLIPRYGTIGAAAAMTCVQVIIVVILGMIVFQHRPKYGLGIA